MARRRGQRRGWLRVEKGSWLLTYRDYSRKPPRVTVTIGPASGPGNLTKKQAQRFAWDHYLAAIDNSARLPFSVLSLGQFWERHYRSHLERKKKYATQTQYKSLWKRWLEPQLADVRLFELKPGQVDAAIQAALDARKGTATARHIRKVASAIVEHARALQMFTGDNPAQLVELPSHIPVRKPAAMTLEQCRQWFSAAEDSPANPKDRRKDARPLRTMSLLGVLCSLGVSEQMGLRWGHVNLEDHSVLVDGEIVEARSLAIREHSYHGHNGTLKHGHRRREVPLPTVLVDRLSELRLSSNWTRDEDPVFAGQAGVQIWADNLQKRVLKPLAVKLGMPWLSWHVFRHTCATLTKTAGMLDVDRRALMGHSAQNMTDRYTHEDFERMRAVIESIAADVTAKPKKPADSDLRSDQRHQQLARYQKGAA